MVTSNIKYPQRSTLNSDRRRQLAAWVIGLLSGEVGGIEEGLPLKPIVGDASFRKYYRVMGPKGSLIAVDAPPETEDSAMFVKIAKQWRQQGINVPIVHDFNLEKGFMLLEDFGDHLLHEGLLAGQEDTLYAQAMTLSKKIQLLPSTELPVYDESLLQFELSLYPQWFLKSLLGLQLTSNEEQAINDIFDYLMKCAFEQPKVTVHRDFHSRNLMLCEDGRLGVIDFQGALQGPILYDIASLLKDCYHVWPAKKVEQWLMSYISDIPQLSSVSPAQVIKWFDWIGLQRHLKCLGIFSRLWLRDHRTSYLSNLPQTLDHVIAVCKQYSELEHHGVWLEKRVLPQVLGRVEGIREEAGV
ncbi:MAG: phosphotransferase [Endozoicomonas sp. (ex Botrylloides leachii)]|nr:phosphotransferase [Endozoicomonas sp. (ex Botrylloides leachii)]